MRGKVHLRLPKEYKWGVGIVPGTPPTAFCGLLLDDKYNQPEWVWDMNENPKIPRERYCLRCLARVAT